MNATMTPPAESHDFFKKCWTTTLPILQAVGINPDVVTLTEYCTLHSAVTGGLRTMIRDGATNTHIFNNDVNSWMDDICPCECRLARCEKAVCTWLFNNRVRLMRNEFKAVFGDGVTT